MHVYDTPERIKEIKEESDFIGRNVSRIDRDDPRHLTIYALPPKRRSKPKAEVDEEKGDERQTRRGNGYNRYKEMD